MLQTVESRYPDQKARRKADLVIERMDNEVLMSQYLRAWEAAYIAAGGRVVLK